jgi:hypothetical protein
MRERGSALITVVLVVLVLTMVGIAGALFMQVEDRISKNDQLQQAGLYASEGGLRVAEKVVYDAAVADSTAIDAMLAHVSTSVPALQLPGGGFPAVVLADPTTGVEYANIAIPVPAGITDRATYTLYVRNNLDDTTHSATVDGDSKINIIAVGEIQDPSGRRVVEKIIEEQMDAGGAGGLGGPQLGGSTAGTGAVGIK